MQSKREKGSGTIITALGDVHPRVVLDADDDLAGVLRLLDAKYASNRTSCIRNCGTDATVQNVIR